MDRLAIPSIPVAKRLRAEGCGNLDILTDKVRSLKIPYKLLMALLPSEISLNCESILLRLSFCLIAPILKALISPLLNFVDNEYGHEDSIRKWCLNFIVSHDLH